MELSRDKVCDYFEDLENRSNFHVILSSVGKPLKETELNKVEKKIKRKVPETILEVFNKFNGLFVEWNSIVGGQTVSGKIEIRKLKNFFSKEVPKTLNNNDIVQAKFWSNKLTDKDMKGLEDFYILDNLSWGNFVLFKLDNNMEEPELYLYTYLNNLTRLKLSFSEYIETALETRGMYLWQQYATASSHCNNHYTFNDNFINNMSLLFPGVDIPLIHKEAVDNLRNISEVQQKDYLKLLKQRLEVYSNKVGLSVNTIELEPPSSIAFLNKAQECVKQSLPEVMIDLFSQSNGLSVEWIMNNGKLLGQIRIPKIENMFGGPHGVLTSEWNEMEDHKGVLWFDDFEEEDIEIIKPMKPLDRWGGVSVDITIKFTGEDEPELYIIDVNGIEKLPLTVAEYFDYMITFLGFPYWPYIFINKADMILESEGKSLLECLKELFDDVDVDALIEKHRV